MACSDEDHGRSRRPDAEDRGWSHRSGTRWPDDRGVGWHRVWSAPCTWRREARVSWLSLKTKVDDFLRFGLKTGDDGFSGLGLKTDRSGLMIWASKSLRQFLNLCLKIKQTSVCRLRHKTDRGRTAQDTRQDLVACFT
jgi:hypothetical protein